MRFAKGTKGFHLIDVIWSKAIFGKWVPASAGSQSKLDWLRVKISR